MNNRVIVLEGPDCGGKSTLAETLVLQHGFHQIHIGQPAPGEDTFKTYTDILMSALEYDQPIVFDRLHIGECIYGPVMRGTDTLTSIGATLINRILTARDAKLIFCLPHKDRFRESYKSRGDDYVKKLDTAEMIYDLYNDYAAHHPEFEVYNYQVTSTYEEREMLFSPRPALPFGCTGSNKAHYLIVGEITNHNVTEYDLPFHYLGNSSAWLHQALELSRVREDRLAFTNAKFISGEPRDLERIVNRLPQFRHAVALGRHAEDALKKAGIPSKYVEHPSSAKRFKHNSPEDYARQLKEALK